MRTITKNQHLDLRKKGANIFNRQWFELEGIQYYYDIDNSKGWSFKTPKGFYNQGSFGYTLEQIMKIAPEMVRTHED